VSSNKENGKLGQKG